MASFIKDGDWSYLRVTGPDRAEYFHRLTTNRVPKAGSPVVHNFLLSTSAKVIAEFWMQAEDEALCLILPKAQLEQAKEIIERYHFSESFEVFEPQGSLYVLIDYSTSQIEELKDLTSFKVSPDPRYGEKTLLVFVEEEKLGPFRSRLQRQGIPLSQEQLELLRLDTGRPRFGLDYTENTLFLEMAQEGDFSESKGCYPGQEVVARVMGRGRVNRLLRAFKSANKIPMSWAYTSNGKEMAKVTTSVVTEEGSRGLVYVRREVGEDGTQLVGADAEGHPLALTICSRPGELRAEAG